MSMNSSTAGLRVLHHILHLPPAQAANALGRVAPFLTYDEDRKAFDFIRAHFAAHGQMPHADTVLDKVSVFLPPSVEPLEFEVEQLRGRFIEDAMRDASDVASEFLQAGSPQDALTAMLDRLLPVTQEHGGYALRDLRHSEQVQAYKAALAGEGPKSHPLGYPTLDAQGGMEDGDMIGIIGRPGSGKTWLMLKTAITHWGNAELPSEPHMFVTQEMSAKQIERRALPLICGVDPTPFYKDQPIQYEIGGVTHEEYMAKLEQAEKDLHHATAPFLIYDSKMAGTVADIEAIAAMHGVKRIWIDGAYMLAHPDRRLSRYARVPENLDLLKRMCQRTGASVFSSWQFKRGAGKEDADGEPPDLDDIGYSHAIAEYMTVILGLLENPKQVKEQGKKKVTIMKGRNGEQGSFYVNWNFAKCDFEEWEPESMEGGSLTYL